MSLDDAIAIIENHNKWRRGDDTVKATDPTNYGIAIDILLNKVKEKPTATRKVRTIQ